MSWCVFELNICGYENFSDTWMCFVILCDQRDLFFAVFSYTVKSVLQKKWCWTNFGVTCPRHEVSIVSAAMLATRQAKIRMIRRIRIRTKRRHGIRAAAGCAVPFQLFQTNIIESRSITCTISLLAWVGGVLALNQISCFPASFQGISTAGGHML